MTRLAISALAALAVAGCSVSFDPNGQPCDSSGGCLTGYVCDATRHCVSADAGTSGSSGRCGNSVCAVGQRCESDGGAPVCVDRSGAGILCTSGTDCGSRGVCLQQPGSRVGLCSQLCTPGADAGCAAGASCTAVTGARGNKFNLCLDSPPPVGCSSNADCGSDAGLGCLPFDDASQLGGPIDTQLPLLFCDRVSPDGGANGSACSSDASCRSGICAVDVQGGLCVAACGGSGCPAGQSCAAVRDFDGARTLLGCVGPASACGACTGCGPDAPDCDSLLQICVLNCNSTDANPCGGTRSCLTSQSGTSYCAVDGGKCR